jgi:O-antigen/teichoic acid export membrane protein
MIRHLLRHDVSRVISVGGSQIIAAVAAFGVTALQARWLIPSQYGVYAFVIAILGWVANFSELGVFSAASRLLAHSDDPVAQGQLIGACAVVAAVLFVLFGVLCAALAPLVEPIFHLNGGVALLASAPLAGGVALELALQYLCQGIKRVGLITTRNLIARPLTLVLVIAAHFAGVLTVPLSCAAFALGSTVAGVVVFWKLQPAMTRIRANLALIRAEARRANDGAMYVGRVVGSSLFNMDRMLVALFLTPADVGYYALAFSLVSPITLGIQSMVMVSYKSLARSPSIPQRLTNAALAWLAVSTVAGYVLITVFIHQFLPKYTPVLPILVPALLTAAVLGFIALRNQFLAAHRRGRALRRISLAFAAANLVLYLSLIPLAGLKGGAWASLAAALIPLVGTSLVYAKVRGRDGPMAHPELPAVGPESGGETFDAALHKVPHDVA